LLILCSGIVISEATSLLHTDKEGLNLALYTTTGIDDIAKIKVLYDTLKPERVIVAVMEP
jgi:hypothetical protein